MRLFLVVVLTCAGCASATDDATPPRAGHEVVSGGGRIRGGGMRMDVAVGHTRSQQAIKSSAQKLKSTATVLP